MAGLPHAHHSGTADLVYVLALDPNLAGAGDELGLNYHRRRRNHNRLLDDNGLLHYDRLLNDGLLNNHGRLGTGGFDDCIREKARAEDACADSKAGVTMVVMPVMVVVMDNRRTVAVTGTAMGAAGICRLDCSDRSGAKRNYQCLLHLSLSFRDSRSHLAQRAFVLFSIIP